MSEVVIRRPGCRALRVQYDSERNGWSVSYWADGEWYEGAFISGALGPVEAYSEPDGEEVKVI